MSELIRAGTEVPPGSYRCDACGYELHLSSTERLFSCPTCGERRYEPIPGPADPDGPPGS
jgi:hypothetical protein